MVGGRSGNATEGAFCCVLVQSHQRSLGSFGGLGIRNSHVLHCAADRLVAEALADKGEVHVACDQVRSQGVFQDVRVSLLAGRIQAARRREFERIAQGEPIGQE